jgi:hypothetical protein
MAVLLSGCGMKEPAKPAGRAESEQTEMKQPITLFPVEYEGELRGDICILIYPETAFSTEQQHQISEIAMTVWKQYFPMTMSQEASPQVCTICADYRYCEEQYHDEIPAAFPAALNKVSGIGKIVIQGSDPNAEPEDFSDSLRIDKSALHYPVRTEELDGEMLIYSIYFKGGADEQNVNAVREAVKAYDFQLVDDDYAGYISISEKDGKAFVYLDLGNTKPQNEYKIIQGILLAVNDIPDIEKVIINEMNF